MVVLSKQLTAPHDGVAGVATVVSAQIAFSAAAARQLICSLPIGAIVLRAWVEVKTAFNAGTSNLLTVGWGATGGANADDYAPTVDESQAGVSAVVGPFAVETAAKDVYVYYTPGDAAATTGLAVAYVEYVRAASDSDASDRPSGI